MTIPLSPRQQEIARMLAEGADVGEIARALFRSPHTIRFHIRLMAEKIPGDAPPIRKIMRWHFDKAA